MAPKGKKGKGGLSVNFEGVKAFKLPKEGEYVAEVKEVSEETSSNSGQPYLAWTLETEGGATLYYNTSLQPKALWNLRGFLEAMGEEVPDGEMDLDLESYVGNKVVVVIEHETYENKKRARIVDVMPSEDVESTEEEEEVADKKGKKKGKTKEKPSAEDIMEMDADDLQAAVEEFDLDVDLDDHKKLSAKRNAVRLALHGDEDEEEEDEEESEPKKGKKGGKAKEDEDEDEEDGGDDEGGDEDEGVEITEDLIDGMTAKQLEEFIEEQELEVELSGNIKKDRRRVVKAAKEGGLIEEDEEE